MRKLTDEVRVNIVRKNSLTTIIDWTALAFLVIGGLNWGLIAVFDLNLVHAWLGPFPLLEDTIYFFAGFSAVYAIVVAVGSDVLPTI